MEPFTLILEKGLQLAIPEKKQRLSFGVDCVSLLEKICMHKEEKFGKCFCMILLHLLWTFLISKSAFLQIHAEDTILISPMTFWLMVHISKDFNKKNIILEWAFGIYHKELIYKSSAFIGECFLYSGMRQRDACTLMTRQQGCLQPLQWVFLSSEPIALRRSTLTVKTKHYILWNR